MTSEPFQYIPRPVTSNVLPEAQPAEYKVRRVAGNIRNKITKAETLAIYSEKSYRPSQSVRKPSISGDFSGRVFNDPSKEQIRRRLRHQIYKQSRDGVVYYPELLGGLLQAKSPTDPCHWETPCEVLPPR